MYRVLLVVTSLMILGSEQAIMPWDRWSWSMPQEPIEYFFRRQDNLPIKSPTFICECPPHKECVVDFKVNEDMADFLNIRGIIKKEDLRTVREDLNKLIHTGGAYEGDAQKGQALNRKRRSGAEELSCCCPPKNVLLPAFITDKAFNEATGKFGNQNNIQDKSN